MPEAKTPLATKLPEVRDLVDDLFSRGYTPKQAERELQRLHTSERERIARGYSHIPAEEFAIRYSTLAERYRWWKRQHASQAGNTESGEAWQWWEVRDGALVRAVLEAKAFWEFEAGVQWGPISLRLAELTYLVRTVAPDLPLSAVLPLAALIERTEALDEPVRTKRMEAIGRFLGARPWSGHDQLVRYGIAVSRDRAPYVRINELGFVVLLEPGTTPWYRDLAHDLGAHLPYDLVEPLVSPDEASFPDQGLSPGQVESERSAFELDSDQAGGELFEGAEG
jgi:hypothetical protein